MKSEKEVKNYTYSVIILAFGFYIAGIITGLVTMALVLE